MAAQRLSMSKIKQILRLHEQRCGKKEIARRLGLSKNTVKKYLHWLDNRDDTIEELLRQEDVDLEQLYESSREQQISDRYKELSGEFSMILKELGRKHVTRKLLWLEYRMRHPCGYEYAQFCRHLSAYQKSCRPTMVMDHNKGDKLYIDFAGDTWTVYEGLLNEPSEKQLFVASLGYSNYAYVEAVESQQVEDFIGALSRSMEYFRAVPAAIVPDNLKSAVIKTDRYEPELNKVLEDFANHYGTTILPARVAKPRDKSAAEQMVKHTYAQIKAPLRDKKYYSLTELNEAISERLEEYNSRPFQRREGSRQSNYEEEKSHMNPLPEERFEIRKYKRLTVRNNSHILLKEDNHYYSVPYANLGKKVRVIYTTSLVKVYFNYALIAMHARNRRAYGYTSKAEHLPSHYQDYKDRSPEYYKKWASTQSAHTQQVIDKVLSRPQHPEQAYRTCEGIKHLSKKAEKTAFHKACQIACEYQCYQYTFIKALIENGMTAQDLTEASPTLSIKQNHPNIRGKQYYQNQ